jgi:cell division protein FtsQ
MGQGARRKQKQVLIPGWQRVLRQVMGVLGALALLALLGGAGWQLSRIPVERVAVSGDLQHVSREQLEGMVNGSLQGGFLGADLNAMREPLEALPWVHRVVIKRRWPNSLEIKVTEQYPIARWGAAGFVNHEGEVFVPAAVAAMPELPLLEGPAGSQRQLMLHYKGIQERLQGEQLQVLRLTMNERGGLQARLSDGCELEFGQGDVEGKLSRFLAVYRRELEREGEHMRRVDLRYSHGVAVAWQADELKIVGG